MDTDINIVIRWTKIQTAANIITRRAAWWLPHVCGPTATNNQQLHTHQQLVANYEASWSARASEEMSDELQARSQHSHWHLTVKLSSFSMWTQTSMHLPIRRIHLRHTPAINSSTQCYRPTQKHDAAPRNVGTTVKHDASPRNPPVCWHEAQAKHAFHSQEHCATCRNKSIGRRGNTAGTKLH